MGLNATFVTIEVGVGLWSHSLALLADAGHNLADVLSLLLAWGAVVLSRRQPSVKRTYGLRKATILASLSNGALLMIAVGVIGWESVHRLMNPTPVAAWPMLLTAAIGVVINSATAMMFMHNDHDLNARGAFLHMLTDAAVSAAVVLGGVVMLVTGGFSWLDPVLGLGIVVVILAGTWGLLRDSANMALDGVPPGIDMHKVSTWLTTQPGVTSVHDLHVWAMSTTETALTAHVARPDNADQDAFLARARDELKAKFGIDHCTLQIESQPGASCPLYADPAA